MGFSLLKVVLSLCLSKLPFEKKTRIDRNYHLDVGDTVKLPSIHKALGGIFAIYEPGMGVHVCNPSPQDTQDSRR